MKNNYFSKKISDSKLSYIIIILFGMLPTLGYTQIFTFSSTNPAIIGSTINQGATKQPIYRAVIQVTGNGGNNLKKLTFTATGTFVKSDINTTNNSFGYQVWASQTDDLASATAISNIFPPTNSGSPVSIAINTPYWASGNTYYLWITADISPTAIGGHTLTVNALTKDNFTFNNAGATTAGIMHPTGTQIIGTKAIYNSNGEYTFTVPPGVYSINVEAWGSGAGGSNSKNKGGGGGAYAGNPAISVTPGTSYIVSVGQGGTAGNNGQNSSFSSLVIAAGAIGANGGTTANSTGATTFAGGNGGTSTSNGGAGGGGSGGAGGAGGNGANATNNNSGAGGLAGIAGMGSTGGGGGTGGYCVYYSKWYQEWFPGNSGNSPGGGGGENSESGSGSGTGADGQVLISWAAPASMWYKADAGTGTTIEGTGITTWDDQSGSSNNATSQNTAPTFQALGWNFNPSVSFSSGYFLTGSNNLFNDMTFFTVYNTSSSSGGYIWECPAIIGGEVSGIQDDYFLSLMDGKPLFKAKNMDDGTVSTIVTSDNSPRILSATHKKAINGHNLLYINGNLAADQDMGNSGDVSLSKPVRLGIGNHYNPTSGSQFNGNISEVVGSSSVLTTSDRQNFESYLAIKYGITLTHDYTNSASTSIYPIAGYSNDIAGLGRNDTWKLHQKVSASSNMASGNSRVVMATSNDFVSSNVNTPSRTALTNGQYLIWGHNNGSTSTWKSIGSDSIVNRTWKVVNTGSVGSVYFQIDLTGYTSENGIYRLLVDDNTDFTTGVTSYVLTKTSGNLYTTSTPVNFASGVRYFTIAQKSNYWKGTATSTDWGTATNWTAGEVPPTGAKVEYATVINSGIATANNLVLDLSERTVSRVINATTWNLTIPAGKTLTVNNSIITDKNPDRILIKTRTTTSEVANGSLIFHNNEANPVFGTVEMYSKAYIDANADINGDQRYFWQYFGIPVESITAEPTLYGAYVRKSNEAGTDTDDANYYWTELNNASVLNAFDGFEICQPAATTYTFKGQLVNRSLNLASLAYTTGAFYPGENLLANPYTAAIDVSKINFGTNIEEAVYLYNTGSYGQWLSATTLGDNPGQYQSIPQLPAGNNGLPQEVPSMGSMLIKATDANNTGISFNYSDVIKKNETMQRVKSIDAISNTDLVSTMIDLTGLHYSDRMWIFSEPSCTRNFDNGWDGRKILGSSLAPQIFAVEPDGEYQVNSVSDMHDTDLAFQAGDEAEYTLKFTHENIQRQYAGVYLVDLVENKTVDVTQNGSTYTFATAQSDAPAKRFKILTRSYEKGAPDKEAQVKIFTAPGRVFVHNLSTSKGECTLYDIAGRAIKNASFAANTVTEVLNNLTPGAYVVNTITNGEKVSKRVIVQ